METCKNTHVVSCIKKQIQSGNLSKEQIIDRLVKSFFNPEWTDDEVYKAINQAFFAAKQDGIPYGDFEIWKYNTDKSKIELQEKFLFDDFGSKEDFEKWLSKKLG